MIVREQLNLRIELKTSEQVLFKTKNFFGREFNRVDYKATKEKLRDKLKKHYYADKIYIKELDKYNGLYRALLCFEGDYETF